MTTPLDRPATEERSPEEPFPSVRVTQAPVPPARPVRAAVLLLLTFVSTTTLGAVVHLGSRTDVTTTLQPFLSPDTLRTVWSSPELLGMGLRFSIPLLLILLSHELGHYLACRYHRIDCTLPYFLPSPFFIGTFGAFIRIRSRISGRRELFDVGVAGPLAGFVVLVPFLILGIVWSTPGVALVVSAQEATAMLYRPGDNLALATLSYLVYGPLPETIVLNLHPFALAGWVGLLATALNLLPVGQLDGGHILYAVIGRRQRRIVWPIWLGLLSCGFFWRGWLVWGVLLLLLGLRHPPVSREYEPLDRNRKRVAVVALVILVLSFSPRPLDILPMADGNRMMALFAQHIARPESDSSSEECEKHAVRGSPESMIASAVGRSPDELGAAPSQTQRGRSNGQQSHPGRQPRARSRASNDSFRPTGRELQSCDQPQMARPRRRRTTGRDGMAQHRRLGPPGGGRGSIPLEGSPDLRRRAHPDAVLGGSRVG